MDTEQKLRTDINALVEERVSMPGARLRSFVIGARFAKSLRQGKSRHRRKSLRACADVVAAAPGLLKARSDHPLRVGGGGTCLVKTRWFDGATARRCRVEGNVAAALRLHYWVLPDGSVELASVNTHDDMTIPAGQPYPGDRRNQQ